MKSFKNVKITFLWYDPSFSVLVTDPLSEVLNVGRFVPDFVAQQHSISPSWESEISAAQKLILNRIGSEYVHPDSWRIRVIVVFVLLYSTKYDLF
jgi:hypothetical protein